MPLYRHTKLPPPPELGEKTVWQYLPRQTVRRVLFLLVALGPSSSSSARAAGRWAAARRAAARPLRRRTGAPVYHLKVTPPDSPPPRRARARRDERRGPMAWAVFGVVVVAMLAVDLGIFHRKAHEISFKEAATCR